MAGNENRRLRGRQLFAVGRPLLIGGTFLLRLLPRAFSRALLGIFRGLPGYPGLALRYMCVRRLAAACGDNVAIYPGVHLFNIERLRLGSNIKIGEMSFLGAAGGIEIESDVSLAHATTVLTEEHDYTAPGPLRDTPITLASVTIRCGAWIGAGARLTAGVEIGADSAVGAGSVVTHDVQANSVVAGVPARLLCRRYQLVA